MGVTEGGEEFAGEGPHTSVDDNTLRTALRELLGRVDLNVTTGEYYACICECLWLASSREAG